MRIEWVMQIERGSCYDSLKQMTQVFRFTIFCMYHQEFPRCYCSSKSRQAKIQTFLIRHPMVKLGTHAHVPELSSAPRHSCSHLERLVVLSSMYSAHTWSTPYVWQPQELCHLALLPSSARPGSGSSCLIPASGLAWYRRARRHRRAPASPCYPNSSTVGSGSLSAHRCYPVAAGGVN